MLVRPVTGYLPTMVANFGLTGLQVALLLGLQSPCVLFFGGGFRNVIHDVS